MKKIKQILMALAVAISFSSTTNAQSTNLTNFMDTGTVIEDFEFTTIAGQHSTLYTYLDQGYTVVLELGKTDCGVCWTFKQMGHFENLYKKYGPNGTVNFKKILPMFIECRSQNDSATLRGIGSPTMGDWVTGTSYPIVDLVDSNLSTTLLKFVKPEGPYAFNTPTFLIICPDHKLIYSADGLNAVTEQSVVEKMQGRCAAGGTTTGVNNLINAASFSLYPNPVKELLRINIEALAKTKVSFTVHNILGQVMMQEDRTLQHGQQTLTIDVRQLPSGIYMLSTKTEQGILQQKFEKR